MKYGPDAPNTQNMIIAADVDHPYDIENIKHR